MRWLTRWLPARRPATARPARRGALTLESLDRRDLPALLMVVNGSVGLDSTHYHDLASAVGNAAGGDTIQIEPNSSPGAATADKTLTIRGDLADGALNLPQVTALTVSAAGVTLDNLNVGAVTASGTPSNLTIRNSLVGSVSSTSNGIGDGLVLSGDTFYGRVYLGGANVSNNGQIVNNTFATSQDNTQDLFVGFVSNYTVQGNVFTAAGNNTVAVLLQGAPSAGPGNVTIRNNAFALAGNAAVGIDATGFGNVAVLDNVIDTGGRGTGIQAAKSGGVTLALKVEGNDLAGNLVGVSATGDGTAGNTALGVIDLGGGSLGSKGGNVFAGFTGGGGHFAVSATNGANSTSSVAAELNTFSTGVTPAAAVSAANSTIDVSNALIPAAGFVDGLYTGFLKRAGVATSGGELDYWTNALANGASQTQIAQSIAHTNEANAVLVGNLYLKVLGRPLAGGEGGFWINKLNGGGTEEQVVAGLLNSNEYSGRVPRLINAVGASADANYVQSLYALLLGRTGSAGDVNYWVGKLAPQGRDGVALSFMATAEFRGDVVQAMYFGVPAVRGAIALAEPGAELRPPGLGPVGGGPELLGELGAGPHQPGGGDRVRLDDAAEAVTLPSAPPGSGPIHPPTITA